MNNENQTPSKVKYWPLVIVAVIAGLIGFIIGDAASNNDELALVTENLDGEMMEKENMEKAEMMEPEDMVAMEENVMMAKENTLTVTNQPSGNTVTIDTLSLTQEGWVAIHDAGPNGWILGARKFSAGTHRALSIPLQRMTEAGKTYSVVIHRSNGDDVFAFRATEPDRPLTGPQGTPIMKEFQVTASGAN